MRAYLGGGCFWCTEALFQQVKGVTSVESGYSGGSTVNPTYREVSSGRTGHAEVIALVYDPEVVSYRNLVKLHLGSHNPTVTHVLRGETDSQYRSIIFYTNDDEREIAASVIEELQPSFDLPITTEIREFEAFFPAEENHRNYYKTNPDKAYCTRIIAPKLAKFEASFPDMIK